MTREDLERVARATCLIWSNHTSPFFFLLFLDKFTTQSIFVADVSFFSPDETALRCSPYLRGMKNDGGGEPHGEAVFI